MPFVLQQRKKASPLQMVKNWSECAGSKHETEEEVKLELQWWQEYDAYYSQSGWEYHIVKSKK